MEIKVFYSWQSDKSTPGRVNRSFIEDALKKAVKNIRNDETIEVIPVIDRDTLGVSGTPNIPQTILQKIDECDVFVCDITIINNGSKFRLTPNPNVLFELGYALKKLNWDKVVMVMNEAYGNINKLPFDLEKRRAILYNLTPNSEANKKSEQRSLLISRIESAVRAIIHESESKPTDGAQEISIFDQTIYAIENNENKQNLLANRFMEWLIIELDKINSEYIKNENSEDGIIEAIGNSEWLSINFAKLVEVVSVMNADNVAKTIHKGFSKIIERYNIRPRQNLVNYRETDSDFYKFIGHELFVIFISFFMREGRWKLIQELLKEDFYVQNITNNEKGFVSIGYIPQTLKTFENKKQRMRLNRFSLHADELAKRYREGEIGRIVPFNEFMEADLFLFLFTEFNRKKEFYSFWWSPHSNAYNYRDTPKFLIESERTEKAIQIGESLGVFSIKEYQEKLSEAQRQLRDLYSHSREIAPLAYFKTDTIGSR